MAPRLHGPPAPMTNLLYDLRLAARRLAKDWRFACTAIAIMAIGIGASTAVFSLLDAILLRDLPFREPDRLVRIWSANPGRDIARFSVSADDYLDWVDRSRTLELAAFAGRGAHLTGEGAPRRLSVGAVTASLPNVLGAGAAFGRWFTAEEDAPGGPNVAALSFDLARTEFARPADAVGRTLLLDGEPYLVVGVAQPGFRFPDETDLWLPLRPRPLPGSRDNRDYAVIARLEPGASLEQARAEMAGVTAALAEQYPELNTGWTSNVTPLREALVSASARTTLWMLLGAVLLVLLIACFNVAGLAVARASARRQELTIQAALGASRGRLLAQRLAESFALAAAAALVGGILASWAVAAVQSQAPDALPLLDQARLDLRTLLFASAAAAFVALLTGLIPALRVSRVRIADDLREGARSAGSRGGRQSFRKLLVVGQLALSIALLVGAGLLLESLARLKSAPLGFEPGRALAAWTSLPASQYPNGASWTSFYRQLLDRVRAAPGVVAAGISSGPPFSGSGTSINIGSVEPSALGPGETLQTDWRIVSPDLFRALSIPLLEGRAYTEADTIEGATRAVLSESAGRRLWPQESAIGKHISIGSPGGRELEIIGIVGDVRDGRLEAEPDPTLYIHYGYWQWSSAALVVRTEADPASVTSAMREAVAAVDPNLPVYNVRTIESLVGDAAGQAELSSLLLGGFAAVAALLAAIGVYGLLSFLVEQRYSEFGVRLAVGAEARHIVRLVLSGAAILWVAGAAAGCALAWMLSRTLQSALFEVAADDPVIYAAALALLAAVTLAAAWRPAHRAGRIDPVIALRHE